MAADNQYQTTVKLLRMHALFSKVLCLIKLRAIHRWRQITINSTRSFKTRKRMNALASELRKAASQAQKMEAYIFKLRRENSNHLLENHHSNARNSSSCEDVDDVPDKVGDGTSIEEEDGETDADSWVDEEEGDAELREYVCRNLAGFQEVFLKYCRIVGSSDLDEPNDESNRSKSDERFRWILARNDYENRGLLMEDWCKCAASLFISAELLPRRVAVQIFRHFAILRHGKLVLGLDEMISCFVYASQFVSRDVQLSLSPKEMLVITLFKLYNSERYFPHVLEDATAVDVSNSMRQEMSEQLEKTTASSRENKFKSIFDQYCKYGDRRNTGWMSSSKFCKMCRECGVIDKTSLRQQELEICFRSVLSDYIRKRGPQTKQVKRLPLKEIQSVMAIVGRRHYPKECKTNGQAFDRIQSIIIANFKTSAPLFAEDPFCAEIEGKRFVTPLARGRG